MRFADILSGVFMLILVYLIAVNWRGANALLVSSAGASIGLIKTLQGR